jgi:hypothetical protein
VVTAGGGEKKFTLRQCKKRTAKFVFAVRQEKTHDKVCVCSAPMQKRTANIFLAVRFFSPCVFGKTHGKAPICRAPEKIRTANI